MQPAMNQGPNQPDRRYRDLQQLLRSPSTSYWLKDAIERALVRDPIDAMNDAEYLAAVLRDRVKRLQLGGVA